MPLLLLHLLLLTEDRPMVDRLTAAGHSARLADGLRYHPAITVGLLARPVDLQMDLPVQTADHPTLMGTETDRLQRHPWITVDAAGFNHHRVSR